jgi:hypothetical protein
LHVATHHLDDVDAVEEIVLEGVRDQGPDPIYGR